MKDLRDKEEMMSRANDHHDDDTGSKRDQSKKMSIQRKCTTNAEESK